jgi:hypothetical protein
LPSKFASFGSTISTISEVDALTGFPGAGMAAKAAVAADDLLGAVFWLLVVFVFFAVLDIRLNRCIR